MEEFINTERYITPYLAEQCLKIGGLINKYFTGNGFTSASSNIPNESGKPDILIVPNIATAKDKRGGNGRGKYGFAKGKRVLYFYSGSKEIARHDYSDIDLIVCVADSYLYKELYKIPCRYILLDEHHTAKIQSGLRINLYKLFEVLKHKKNVSFVTATPYQNDTPKVVIKNTHEFFNKTKKVNVSVCHKTTIKELKKCLDELKTKKGRILIASNEARKVHQILKDLDVNEVRLMTGDNFRKSFFKRSKVIVNNTADITIMTTSAFEGHDVDDENTSVFVFQNYKNKAVQFLDSQIIQALGRVRNKPNMLHINWGGGFGGGISNTTIKYQNELEEICDAYCRLFNNNQKKQLNNTNRKKESFESEDFKISYKNNKIRLGDVRKFIVFDDYNFENEKKRIAKVNYIACDVLRSKLNIHKNGLNDKYFNERGYKIERYNVMPYDLSFKTIPNTIKTKTLIHNRNINPDYISKSELINWSFDFEKKDDFKKVFDLLKKHLNEKMPNHLDYFFSNYKGMDQEIDENYAIAKERHKDKVENKEESENEKPIRDVIEKRVFEMIKCFIRFTPPTNKIRGFRNFTSFALSSSHIIKNIASKFNLPFEVYDVTALAPSVIQALVGDEKRDVYESGENRKKSKIKINTYLNSIYKDVRNSEKVFNKLKETNFSSRSLQYLKDNIYKSGISGLLLNTYTFYEKQIIKEATRKIDSKHLTITRHDEIIVFFKDTDNETFERLKYEYALELSKIECLGRDDWFGFVPKDEHKEIPKIENIKTPELYPNSNQYTMTF